MKVAAYIRVSTEAQTTDNQLRLSMHYVRREVGNWLKSIQRTQAHGRGRQTELARCIRDA